MTSKLTIIVALLLAPPLCAATLPGDFNADWKVDAADYVQALKSGQAPFQFSANFGNTAKTVGVHIKPTDNFQSIINANPAGTLFYVEGGNYSLASTLTPKSGNAFVSFESPIIGGNNSTKTAIRGNSSTPNVTLYGLTVEKFPSNTSAAAIDSGDGSGWIVDRSEVRLNGAVGVELYNGIIRNSFLHHNGQTGAQDTNGIDGGTALVENCEISWNNTKKFDYDWEAGGIKFAVIHGLTVRSNYIHDNYGQGLWDDIDCDSVLYEGNRVENNYRTGILHEIGGTAIIRNNVVRNNGEAKLVANSGQIIVYASDHTEVYGNTVISVNSNGIVVVQEQREGNHTAHDNSVHHNTITVTGSGQSGQADFGYWSTSAKNTFDYNTYYATANGSHWDWSGDKTWSQLHAAGQELHGLLAPVGSGVPEPIAAWLAPVAALMFRRHRC